MQAVEQGQAARANTDTNTAAMPTSVLDAVTLTQQLSVIVEATRSGPKVPLPNHQGQRTISRYTSASF